VQIAQFDSAVENPRRRVALARCRWLVQLLALVLVCQSSFGQTSLGDWQSVRNLAVDSNISVKTKTDEKYHGDLVDVTAESLSIDSDERGFPGRVTTRRDLRRNQVQEVRLVRPAASLLAGAAIGAGLGAGIGAGVESTVRSNEDRGLLTAVLAILGGAIGAGIAHHYPFIKGKKIYVAP
jgi:hypothetical protein